MQLLGFVTFTDHVHLLQSLLHITSIIILTLPSFLVVTTTVQYFTMSVFAREFEEESPAFAVEEAQREDERKILKRLQEDPPLPPSDTEQPTSTSPTGNTISYYHACLNKCEYHSRIVINYACYTLNHSRLLELPDRVFNQELDRKSPCNTYIR